MRFLALLIAAALLAVPSGACESAPAVPAPGAAVRDGVVASARALLGQKPYARVTVRGREFVLDCTGTVSAAWWGAGYDVQRDFRLYAGGGVNRLFLSAQAWGAVHSRTVPLPGDIIFWQDTYDRNEDAKPGNDGLTHTGLVIDVEQDGTVHYLHMSYSRGVVLAVMNLEHPREPWASGGKLWNSPMYLGSGYGLPSNPARWLAGDLWAGFGDAEKTAAVLASP